MMQENSADRLVLSEVEGRSGPHKLRSAGVLADQRTLANHPTIGDFEIT